MFLHFNAYTFTGSCFWEGKTNLTCGHISGGMDAIDAMHKAASTSGTFDPSIAQSFQQIALVGAFVLQHPGVGPETHIL